MNWLLAAAILALSAPVVVWQIRRAVRQPLDDARLVGDADAQARRSQEPRTSALLDLEPGIDLALQDECELLWSIPEYDRAAADHTTTTTEGD